MTEILGVPATTKTPEQISAQIQRMADRLGRRAVRLSRVIEATNDPDNTMTVEGLRGVRLANMNTKKLVGGEPLPDERIDGIKLEHKVIKPAEDVRRKGDGRENDQQVTTEIDTGIAFRERGNREIYDKQRGFVTKQVDKGHINSDEMLTGQEIFAPQARLHVKMADEGLKGKLSVPEVGSPYLASGRELTDQEAMSTAVGILHATNSEISNRVRTQAEAHLVRDHDVHASVDSFIKA